MELSGRIIAALEPRSGTSQRTGNPWKMQDFVMETMEQFPRRMMFNVFGEDRLAQYNLKVGDMVTVYFDINAREYNGRWYNDVRATNVVPFVPGQMPGQAPSVGQFNAVPQQPAAQPMGQPAQQPAAQPAAQPAQAAQQAQQPFNTMNDTADGLPF